MPGQTLAAPSGSGRRLVAWLFRAQLTKRLLVEVEDNEGGVSAVERPQFIREAGRLGVGDLGATGLWRRQCRPRWRSEFPLAFGFLCQGRTTAQVSATTVQNSRPPIRKLSTM